MRKAFLAGTERKSVEVLVIEIDVDWVRWAEKERGIEEPRVERLCEPWLSLPTLAVALLDPLAAHYPEPTTLTVDGHHRLVRLWRDGRSEYRMLRWRVGTWDKFLIPQETFTKGDAQVCEGCMTREQRKGAATWLQRYSGPEIIKEDMLDKLRAFGVDYSRVERRLYCDKESTPIKVFTRDELEASLRGKSIRYQLEPGNWRGVHVVEVSRALCMIAGLGDPAIITSGTHSQHERYIMALMGTEPRGLA
jgi:hypothetical protein